MLEIKNLSCGYDSKLVLHNVNFKLQEEELVGIIGPNGCGKTTLLRAITRVIMPKTGDIFLEGKNIARIGFKELARFIAVVSQSLPQGSMSVEEFVLLGRTPHLDRWQFFERKKDLEAAKRCMELTDILRLKQQPIDQLSGGERQLAVIARALAQEPRLLLLDEPTAHLDIAHQVKILGLIKRLNRDFGLSVITVLHDLNLASLYCDRLLLLNNGLIHKQGRPEDVLTYRIIEEVYRTVVVVKESPVSGKPHIFLSSHP